jgi:DNA-binding CsgD family transcriptional regulator
MLRDGAEALEEIPLFYDAARIRRQLAGRLAELDRPDEALDELRRVHETFSQLGARPELEKTREMFEELDRRPPTLVGHGPGAAELTPREWDVALCIARRMSSKAAGKALRIRERTVTTHLTRIYRKLDISGREELGDLVREGRLAAPTDVP